MAKFGVVRNGDVVHLGRESPTLGLQPEDQTDRKDGADPDDSCTRAGLGDGMKIRRVSPNDRHFGNLRAVWPDRWRWQSGDGWYGFAVTRKGALRLGYRHVKKVERAAKVEEF